MSNEQQYLDLLQDILTNGMTTNDRTGVGTKSLFKKDLKFDLEEGFPLLTTKKMSLKSIATELLWFLSGSVNVQDLKDRKCNIWNKWEREDGTIGEGYGKQFVDIQYQKTVTPRVFEKPKSVEYKQFEMLEIQKDSDECKGLLRAGDEISAQDGSKWVVVGQVKKDAQGAPIWGVQSLDNGFAMIVNDNNASKGRMHNPYLPSVAGVGVPGEISKNSTHAKMLSQIWRSMIKMCYDPSAGNYKEHGGRGVFVCERWLSFENFFEDAQKLPNWSLKVENPKEYDLDKDILSFSNCFHPETAMWATKEEILLNSSANKYFSVKNANGEVIYIPSGDKAGPKVDLGLGAVKGALTRSPKAHKGMLNPEFVAKEGAKVLRWRKINPFKKIVADIKHNPNSRRHVMSLWNVHDNDNMELPPCHGTTIQFYVNNGKLMTFMHQRSCDAPIGLPYNIASYALLAHIVAHLTGNKVGELTISLGDVHIYKNQIEGAKEQLERSPMALPKVKFSAKALEASTTDDFALGKLEPEDFSLEGYESHPAIKMPVAV